MADDALDTAKRLAAQAHADIDREPQRVQRLLLLAGVNALVAVAERVERVERALDALDHRS